MKEEIFNPFLINGYVSPEYFCGRENDTKKIISGLENGRNITLISPRRIGKTGLIHHVFYNVRKKDKNLNCFYFDIFATQNLYEFTVLFAKTIIGKLDNISESVIKRITQIFKGFNPTFSYDAVTGEPSVSFSFNPADAQQNLEDIFAYLKNSKRNIYIAIDEFQQITEYPEKGVEALLRSHIQFLPNVKFIFAGSKKHIMDAMFSNANRPFYQSTQKLNLKEINIDSYREFAVRFFKKSGKMLENTAFDYIYSQTMGYTWYIQIILNYLYTEAFNTITVKEVEIVIGNILEEEKTTYKTYCEIITKGQLDLLRAIAKEKKVKETTNNEFIKKHNLTAPSSIRLARNSLQDKTLILKDDEGYYYVYDRFFSLWLERV